MSKKYDLVVIGAGPAGYTAAISAAQHEMKVAIIEAGKAGGTCLNRGCIPTKTLLHAADLYREIKHSESVGVCADKIGYDITAMYRRKDEVVDQLKNGIEALLQANKVDLFYGMAQVSSSHKVVLTIEGKKQELETDNVLLAAGSKPIRPNLTGMDLSGVITSDELLSGQPVDYKKLVIIGGGVIGVEFASIFSSLGCEVTIIEGLGRILPKMDREISQNLSMILKKNNVCIHTGSTVEGITKSEGMLCCHFTGKSGKQEVKAEGVLIAIGRKPNLDGLFDDKLKLKIEHGIQVDQNFETSEQGIYAIGDVIEGSMQLAHEAFAQAQNVVAYIAGEKPPIHLLTVPACIYTSPEIATAGITQEQAKEQGITVKVGKYILNGNGKTVIEQQERSFVKLVFDSETEILLGAQLMCSRASDLISELSVAIVNKLTIHQLAAVIRPHPTFTEAITEAVEDAKGCAIHIMPKRK